MEQVFTIHCCTHKEEIAEYFDKMIQKFICKECHNPLEDGYIDIGKTQTVVQRALKLRD